MKILSKIYKCKFSLLAILLCITYFSLWRSKKNASLNIEKYYLDRQKITQFFSVFHSRHTKLNKIKTRSRVYDAIFEGISLYDLLMQHTLEDRCKIYFNQLSASNPDWEINPHKELTFDRDAYKSFETYRLDTLKKANEEKKADADADAEADTNADADADADANAEGNTYKIPSEENMRMDYDKVRSKTLRDEQTLHDYTAHVRIFNKCFMIDQKDDESFVKKQHSFLKNEAVYERSAMDKVSGKVHTNELSCRNVENKLFPWITSRYPEFERWNGAKPFFPGWKEKEGRGQGRGQGQGRGRGRGGVSVDDGCFLSEYKSRLNGRGIVMSLKDHYLGDATRFIRVLRHMGNRYPIQVVYHEGLSDESKKNLVRAAQDPFRGYVGQDLWFVNAAPAIEESFRSKFGGFSNKIAASMFNSFEEMMFCDADAVLLKSPAFFFELKKFVQSGTMFFKDRASGMFRGKDDIFLFQKLLPSVEDSAIFNVPQTSNFTLENEFMNHFSHYMESGVALINRKRHFIHPLMMSLLSFYTPVYERVYGDKEIFWLSFAIAGDESYAFNDNFAASIGEFTPDVERQKDLGNTQSFRSLELCSNHPAHISDVDNHTLLWFNSGFRHCGNAYKGLDWDNEFSKKVRYTKFTTLNEFRTFISAPLKIHNAIIPPFLLEDRELPNLDNEPTRQWRMADYCNGYLWCAYSQIGGSFDDNGVTKDNSIYGTVVKFTPQEVKSFEAAGDVWGSDFDWSLER